MKKIFQNIIAFALFVYGVILIFFVNDVQQTYIETNFSFFLLFLLSFQIIFFKYKIFIPKIFLFLLFFILYSLLSLLLNDVSYFDPFFTLIKIFIFSIVLFNFFKNNNSFKPLAYGIVFSVLLNILIGYFLGRDFFGHTGYRYGGSLINPNHYSFVLCLSISFLLWILSKDLREYGFINYKVFVVVLLIMLFSFEIIFYTSSRQGILTLTFLFLYYLYYIAKNRSYVTTFFSLSILVAFLFLINSQLILFPQVNERISAIFTFLLSENKDVSISYRSEYIYAAINYFIENPIFGIGLDQFRIQNDSSYSHNNYVELLCSVGFFGFILYYYSFFKLILKSISSRNENRFGFVFLIIILLSDLSAVNYLEKPIWITFCIATFILSSEKDNFIFKFK